MSGPTDKQRAAERAGRRSRIVSTLAAALPALDADSAMSLLEQAKADRGIPLRELDEYLAAHPGAFPPPIRSALRPFSV